MLRPFQKVNQDFMLKGLIFSALWLWMPLASAAETLEVCATYKNSGMKYRVNAHVLTGSELNERTSSFRFSYFSKYAVIFWGDGQATIIELDFALGGIGPLGSSGRDQRGYPWELSTSTIFCF